MNGPLETVVVVVSLVPGSGRSSWSCATEASTWAADGCRRLRALAVLVQLVVGIVLLAGSDRDFARGTFVGYLVGALLVPPAGVAWAVGEKNRYGSAVLLVVFLVIPVMVLRLHDIWAALG